MPLILSLPDLTLAVEAETVTETATGWLLTGTEVAVLNPPGVTHFYRHGFQSWSLTTWLEVGSRLQPPKRIEIWPHADHPNLLASGHPRRGSGVSAVRTGDGRVLLLGALAPGAQVTAGPAALSGVYSPLASKGAPGTWFLGLGTEEQVFAAYAARLGERLGRRGASPPRVWCSWYSLYREIDEGGLLGILADLSRPPQLPFDVFQIDDGWQIALGDWSPNDKFPSGMAVLAQRAAQAGLRAGLWLAPFLVSPQSELFRRHPDWLLRGEDGNPLPAGHNWGNVFYSLDLSHPDVLDWLAELVRRVRAWGYDYLKLDFLYAGALPGVRRHPLDGETAYRQALGVVREAAGEDAYILVCGAPVLASIGLADGIRIGPDVAPFWDNPERSVHLSDLTGPGTQNAIRTSLHRLWLKALIDIDPDVVFFRTRYNLLQPGEKELLQALAQICGFRATSDLPAWLDPDERLALHTFLETAPAVERLDACRWRVGAAEFDFTAAVNLPE